VESQLDTSREGKVKVLPRRGLSGKLRVKRRKGERKEEKDE